MGKPLALIATVTVFLALGGSAGADAVPNADIQVTSVRVETEDPKGALHPEPVADGATYVLRAGEEVRVSLQLANAGPDPSDCWVVASLPDQGATAFASGYRVVGPDAIGSSMHGGCSSALPETHEGTIDFIGAMPGVSVVRFVAVGDVSTSDPNPANNTWTLRFRVLSAKKTFVEVREPVWSPNGNRIAFVRWIEPGVESPYSWQSTLGQVWVVNADGSGAHPVTPVGPVPRSLSWSPDSTSLSFTSGAPSVMLPRLWTVNVRTKSRKLLGEPCWNPSWSPDGKLIAYLTEGSHGGEADVIPATGGQPRYVAYYGATPGENGTPLQWSPDSRYISLGYQDYPGLFWPVDGSGAYVDASTVITPVDLGAAAGVATHLIRLQRSPDGRFVAGSKSTTQRVEIASVATGRTAEAPQAQSWNDRVSWSPGDLLAYVASSPCGDRTAIRVVRPDGSKSRVIARAC